MSATTVVPRNKFVRFEVLDVLRLLFVLGIVFFHYGNSQLYPIASMGVSFFFICSGYLLTIKRGYMSWPAVVHHLTRKATLFYPLSWLSIALGLGIPYLLGFHQSFGIELPANILLIHPWFSATEVHFTPYGAPLWFLGSLLFCYAMYHVVYQVIYKVSFAILFPFFVVIAIAYGWVLGHFSVHLQDFLYVFPPMRLLDFALGITLARAYIQYGCPRFVAQNLALLQWICSIAVITMIATYISSAYLPTYAHATLWWLPNVALIYLAACTPNTEQHLPWTTIKRPWLMWLCALSLEIYILHSPVTIIANYLVAPVFGHFGIMVYDYNTYLSLPLLLPMAIATHRIVTRPLSRIAKQI